ncbi:MAG: Hsp33 family molecular chaperone HslO [Oscillospiraceae bacterium]|jgi:molecular chaperone Hsp33|nr:Hsp33 family molecular chaperone HslO [Oscillospiraceae bacterium]
MSKIVRALSADGSVLCAAVDSTDIVNEIHRIHKTSPVASAALGRLATAGVIMGSLMKNERDLLTLRVSGGGPAGVLTVTADYKGNVRCCAGKYNVDLPPNAAGKLDVAGYVGKEGLLGVIRDTGLKEPYSAQIPLISGEIAEDITSYYATSEQIPTVCALGVLVERDWSIKAAGGYLLQLLPPVEEEKIEFIENNIKKMQSVTEMLENGMTAKEIALAGLEGLAGNILDEWEVFYKCDCSRERTSELLSSLGKDELRSLSESGENIEVCCHFCDKKYHFEPNEIKYK